MEANAVVTMNANQQPGVGRQWCLFLRGRFKLVVLALVLCSLICRFIVVNMIGIGGIAVYSKAQKTPNDASMEEIDISRIPWSNSYEFIHVNRLATYGNASFLVIFPYSAHKGANMSQQLHENDKRALWKLRNFLSSMDEFDGATCLRPPNKEDGHDEVNTVRNITLKSSWCSFIQRKWSVNIRNTGLLQHIQLQSTKTNPSFAAKANSEESIEVQHCNIVQGPFVIRKDVFHRLGGLLDGFGKVTLLEFFLRSKGELKIAKLANCQWTSEITRADRGTLKGSNNLGEYASFGNKHKVLRIVTESQIEWTACVANWKSCPEKPYVKPRDLPGVAEPICCSVVLAEMLADSKWALNKLGLEYRILFGTLLGAVRSKAIIPWSYDVDIGISNATFRNKSTFTALQQVLGSKYYVGRSHGMPRAHRLIAPYIEVDTTPFFSGPDDLNGDALFSDGIEEAVQGMLPISDNWRSLGYADLYACSSNQMRSSSLVTINNENFTTVKEVDKILKVWYGENYRKPILKGKWVGMSDKGYAR